MEKNARENRWSVLCVEEKCRGCPWTASIIASKSSCLAGLVTPAYRHATVSRIKCDFTSDSCIYRHSSHTKMIKQKFQKPLCIDERHCNITSRLKHCAVGTTPRQDHCNQYQFSPGEGSDSWAPPLVPHKSNAKVNSLSPWGGGAGRWKYTGAKEMRVSCCGALSRIWSNVDLAMKRSWSVDTTLSECLPFNDFAFFF